MLSSRDVFFPFERGAVIALTATAPAGGDTLRSLATFDLRLSVSGPAACPGRCMVNSPVAQLVAGL